ncbi:MAG: hypothetical protein Q7S52_02305 [bacterium]|nr:hypothetical protein [bacterium]
MNKKRIVAYVVALLVLIVPAVVLAHGAIDDGHIEEAVIASDGHMDHDHSIGGSELLVAFSAAWWGLLGVSTLLTALLSFGVWKFLRVPPVKGAEIRDKK